MLHKSAFTQQPTTCRLYTPLLRIFTTAAIACYGVTSDCVPWTTGRSLLVARLHATAQPHLVVRLGVFLFCTTADTDACRLAKEIGRVCKPKV